MLVAHQGKFPRVAKTAFVEDSARVVGDVQLGAHASVWFCAVVRGDSAPVRIGRNSNVQDNSVLHADVRFPLTVGDNVTIGHSAVVHGCTVASNCLIGMGAIVLNGAKVGEWSIIGAGALVTAGTAIAPDSVAVGTPAKPVRKVGAEDREFIRRHYVNYLDYTRSYLRQQTGHARKS